MCGIFSILNSKFEDIIIEKEFNKGKSRGPESNTLLYLNENKLILGFHRLAINGYKNPKSEQPLKYKNCILICNGEIYNWDYLHKCLNIPKNSYSDCEIIIHLYKKYGIEYTLNMLDGVFAFILFDTEKKELFVARDTYGVRPLFFAQKNSNLIFSSILKCITSFNCYVTFDIKQFEPGTYSKYSFFNNEWNNIIENKIFSKQICFNFNKHFTQNIESATRVIHDSLVEAVKKRILNTDRPIACLLSGGLDSSLITSIVKANLPPNVELHTWSIGFKGSEDLLYANMVADFLNTKHHSIVVKEEDFLNAIPEVIKTIESYDTTTVRASVGNWMISKFIKTNSQSKVIFNGDGSDEVTGGYMYFHLAPNSIDFDFECRRLLNTIHYFDVLRSDRSISSNGLEARTPFLDKQFVQNYLNISHKLRFLTHKNHCEKYLLRKAFEKNNYLPHKVLWRTKEAFSDGVSSNNKSWFEVIQEHLEKNYKPKYSDEIYSKLENPPKTLEQKYYRDIFISEFGNIKNVIPYFWMPKFTNAKDASARTLNVYKNKKKK